MGSSTIQAGVFSSLWPGVLTMKFCLPMIRFFAAGAALFGPAVFAQDMPTTPAAATTNALPPTNTADLRTPKGEVTVNSAPAGAPAIAPPPSFEQLSGGGKTISERQAHAYPPLANDFIHADSNRDGTISKAEYLQWLKQL
jgi:hypothetical protein